MRPEGIFDALMAVQRYGKPIIVEECGCADAHDRIRVEYIRAIVAGIERAHEAGVDVRGFMYWSILDNMSGHMGLKNALGLWRWILTPSPAPSAPPPMCTAMIFVPTCAINEVRLH